MTATFSSWKNTRHTVSLSLVCECLFLFCVSFFEIGSHYRAQDGLELPMLPSLAFLDTEIDTNMAS
jgi:hypothetical protein